MHFHPQAAVAQHSPRMLTPSMHKDMVITVCECYAQNWYVYIVSALTGFVDVLVPDTINNKGSTRKTIMRMHSIQYTANLKLFAHLCGANSFT